MVWIQGLLQLQLLRGGLWPSRLRHAQVAIDLDWHISCSLCCPRPRPEWADVRCGEMRHSPLLSLLHSAPIRWWSDGFRDGGFVTALPAPDLAVGQAIERHPTSDMDNFGRSRQARPLRAARLNKVCPGLVNRQRHTISFLDPSIRPPARGPV